MSVANDSRPPYHVWQIHSGKTLNWLSTDSQLLYNNHCHDPKQRARLEQAGWYPYTEINYQFNSHGFRTDEFDSSPRILTLGCSYTQGIGLHRNQTWPELLAVQLEKQVWNLGVGGGSLDTCFRLLEYWIEHLNIQAVVVLAPELSRVEVVLNNSRVESCGSWRDDDSTTNFYRHWIDHPDNSTINRRKNILAMQHICNQQQAPILFYYPETEFRDKIGGKARDLLHYGAGMHLQLANKINTDLKDVL
jgi:hypothetical protein